MTTGIEALKPPPVRRGRGPGKKPALVCTSIRLPKDVMKFFEENYGATRQAKMREILSEYVYKCNEEAVQLKGNEDGKE